MMVLTFVLSQCFIVKLLTKPIHLGKKEKTAKIWHVLLILSFSGDYINNKSIKGVSF